MFCHHENKSCKIYPPSSTFKYGYIFPNFYKNKSMKLLLIEIKGYIKNYSNTEFFNLIMCQFCELYAIIKIATLNGGTVDGCS